MAAARTFVRKSSAEVIFCCPRSNSCPLTRNVGVPVTPRLRMSRGKVLRKDGFPGFHMQKNRSVNLAEDGGHPTRSSRLRGATRGT